MLNILKPLIHTFIYLYLDSGFFLVDLVSFLGIYDFHLEQEYTMDEVHHVRTYPTTYLLTHHLLRCFGKWAENWRTQRKPGHNENVQNLTQTVT